MSTSYKEIPVALAKADWEEVLDSLRINQSLLEEKSKRSSGLYRDILRGKSSTIIRIVDEIELNQSFAEK